MISTRAGRRFLVFVFLSAALLAAGPALALWGDHFDEETARIERALALRPGATVADIGAGDGRFSFALARAVGPTGHVYATEIDPKNLAKIRSSVEKEGLANVTVIEAGVSDTGLAPDCCDAILMRGVYHHLTDPEAIDASLWKALRPGGLFAVVDFPPSFWLSPWKVEGVPANRGGHGIDPEIVAQELAAVGFAQVSLDRDWPTGWFTDLYCALFRKPASRSYLVAPSPPVAHR